MAKGITTAEMTNEQFVANLYLNLLQRSPKTGEVKHWTGVLGSGTSRSDVVEVFMSSSEFITLQSQRERFHVSSPGSEKPRPEQELLSKLQTHVARQQSLGYEIGAAALSEEAVRESETVRELEDVLESEDVTETETPAITKLSSELWETEEAVGRLNPRNSGSLNYLVQKAKKALQRSLTWYTHALRDFHFQVVKALKEHENDLNSLDQSLRRVDTKTLRLDREISRLDNEILRLQSRHRQELLQANDLAIQEQLLPYVDFFRGVSPVLDLGCGAGAFLVLLKENGVSSYGVDSDETACEAGRRKSLKVVRQDLLEHLRRLPDRSLGGVFSARVIEFLSAHAQMELISLCAMKIKPGGVLVIETTNPDSRRGYGRISYLDPTHLLAVPPELMKSALESNCFRDVKITVLAPVEESPAQVVSTANSGNHPEWDDGALPAVSNRLAISPAYAVAGRRS
jgi:2-polyprenyl-3-methyl-5-hydroxy-6-metoxy-1,4-benzoquinol methylase